MAPYFLRNLVRKKEQRQQTVSLFRALRSLTGIQWAQVFVGWLAWTCESIDLYSLSFVAGNQGQYIAKEFKKNPQQVSSAVTITLLFRPIGALLFGILSDRYGRKWPLVCNLFLLSAFQLCTGFVREFDQFNVVRSASAIAMGGIWGVSTSNVLENLPIDSRGFFSGVLQQGSAAGYVISAVISMFLVPKVKAGWRSLYWIGFAISFVAACLRAILPESESFSSTKAAEQARGIEGSKKTKEFWKDIKKVLKWRWLLCVYAVVLMTSFGFLMSASQDMYFLYLVTNKELKSGPALIMTLFGSIGATLGSPSTGNLSQRFGRRIVMIVTIVLLAAFVPISLKGTSFFLISNGAFGVQQAIQGAMGVIPIYLAEISPPALRATFPGVAYQMGNIISSVAPTIQAFGAEHLTTKVIVKNSPVVVPDYGTLQAIFISAGAVFLILVILVGPEKHGLEFEKQNPVNRPMSIIVEIPGPHGYNEDIELEKGIYDTST